MKGHRLARHQRLEKKWKELAQLYKEGYSARELAQRILNNKGKSYTLNYIYMKIREYSD